MDDKQIRERITDMVARERALRDQLAAGTISDEEEHGRLAAVEHELDQCWDLLRQRQALRDAGGDPASAAARPVREVEGYQQ
ncbi:DUF2630 family protein [Streptomyces sp. SID3343]|uniref:DUF2630 family protein n=1 Tax=Streptomyces sp. SID3343 TaxID=2690260 RepID=UPI00136A2334|nr:DUF2630 family protein [Streptomyces sp. SID3343]MYW05279.1 DUF2630 family protein [Streptomyces sp. SID3343]